MKTDNELIAEFMGIRIREHTRGLFYVTNDEEFIDWKDPDLETYAPDIKWNQLMPVVEKIEQSGCYVSLNANTCGMWNYFNPNEILRATGSFNKFKSRSSGKTKIEATHKAIIEYIKWHNHEQSKE